jgi:hypothetical protein
LILCIDKFNLISYNCFQDYKRAFKSWRSKAGEINYRSQFKEELSTTLVDDKLISVEEDAPLDIVADVLPLKVGCLLKALSKDPVLGYLPLMAQASKGQIGTLNAESFCERCLSMTNLVMTEGNTLLSNEETGMLTTLRMNAGFMDYMRARSPKSSKQRLN